MTIPQVKENSNIRASRLREMKSEKNVQVIAEIKKGKVKNYRGVVPMYR